MSKIERIVNGQLMKLLKSGLVSRDESKIEVAIDQVDDVASAVESLEDQYALDEYQSARIRKVKNLLKSMKDGGEFVAKVREPQEHVRELRNEMRDALDTLYRNPNNWQAQSRVNELRQQHLQLDAQIRNSLQSPWSNLQADLRMGYLSNEDMRVFQTPYQQLMSDMRGITDPCLSSLGSVSGARCLNNDPTGRSTVATIPSDIDTPMAPGDLLKFRNSASRGQPGALGPALSFSGNSAVNLGNQGLSFPPSAMSPNRSVPFASSPMPTGMPYSPMNSNVGMRFTGRY
jgi:hypothetical protein